MLVHTASQNGNKRALLALDYSRTGNRKQTRQTGNSHALPVVSCSQATPSLEVATQPRSYPHKPSPVMEIENTVM